MLVDDVEEMDPASDLNGFDDDEGQVAPAEADYDEDD